MLNGTKKRDRPRELCAAEAKTTQADIRTEHQNHRLDSTIDVKSTFTEAASLNLSLNLKKLLAVRGSSF